MTKHLKQDTNIKSNDSEYKEKRGVPRFNKKIHFKKWCKQIYKKAGLPQERRKFNNKLL